MVTLEQQQQQRPTYKDTLIRGREFLLNRLAGASADMVLNPVRDDGKMPPPADLSATIKQTLDDLKATAMDQDGAKVDYAARPTLLIKRSAWLSCSAFNRVSWERPKRSALSGSIFTMPWCSMPSSLLMYMTASPKGGWACSLFSGVRPILSMGSA